MNEYRLTFFTKNKATKLIKIYNYYWETEVEDQSIYKVRTDYIEFYNNQDVPHFCDGILYHREKEVKIYDCEKETLITRYSPVVLRNRETNTKQIWQIEDNYFNEEANEEDTTIINEIKEEDNENKTED